MEIIKCERPPKNYAVSKKMDIVVPEVPELVTKVLIPPTEPSFTDKIGWHPLNVPKQDRYLEIEVPPLRFERNSSSTLTLDEEQIPDALPNVGVKEIVLAVNYQPEVMVSAMNQVEEEFKVKITFSIEPEPLGTGDFILIVAGPLSLARDVLGKGDEPFFVLNSDVICEFPFKYLLDFHKSHGAEGTLMTTPVEDPSKYGVVCLKAESTQIERFVEKPQTWVGDQINAGIYIFNPAILKRITHERPMSIEKEVFPHMARAGQLHATPLEGFWADVGQPKDFLTGSALYLESLAKKSDSRLHKADYVSGNVLVDPTAKIGKGCKIGPNVVIGPNAVIGDGVRLKDAVIMGGANIKDFAWINKSIIGWHSSVGRWTRIDEITVLGEDVHVKDEIFTNGATVLPHKSVGANISTPQIVM
ncbi:mannose-1-phosphate guanyltransferase [Boothiomyces macroporosus]|uniref:mannose-1-phosphate guanylyltransferase n=1 Tax=Boothiomyces macroporosus TaxID=261099 RepID=A0AAD5UQG9_9FUNG|nr:mannose-1-phosphate guanyltransferase [Boothiomyces macroporosus]